MASRLMRWLGMMVLSLAVVAVWALPPRSPQEWFFYGRRVVWDLTPEERAFRELNGELGRVAGLNRMLVWGDSLRALAGKSRSAGEGYFALLPDSAPAADREALEDGVREQLRRAGVEVPAETVGTLVMDRKAGSLPGASPGFGRATRTELHVGTDPAAPFCFLAQSSYGAAWRIGDQVERLLWRGSDSSSAPAPLGPCLFHAKYGTPGAEIFAWLSSGGYGFGVGTPRYVPVAGLHSSGSLIRGFGIRTFFFFSPEGQRCAQGDREGCRDVALMAGSDPGWSVSQVAAKLRDLQGFGVSVIREGGTGVGFGGHGVRIFYELEEEFGEEAFARFWTSDRDVEAAFGEAFGLPFEDWLVRWTGEEWGHPAAGPPVPLQATALSFISLGLLAGLALYMGRRKA